MPYFGKGKHELLSRTISILFDKKSSNQFYIHINVVGIPLIYLFDPFILLLIKFYSMWCALSDFVLI